jgi:vesicle coat complex subunit
LLVLSSLLIAELEHPNFDDEYDEYDEYVQILALRSLGRALASSPEYHKPIVTTLRQCLTGKSNSMAREAAKASAGRH